MDTNDRVIDLNASLERAVSAARRGDAVSLELELSRLRRVRAASVSMVGAQLRGIAEAVKKHPAYGRGHRAEAV